jgi:hypothetical protein
MAQNINPIFAVTGDVSNNAGTGMNALVLTAANDYTGAGVNNSLVFTAGANGAFVQRLRMKPGGTNVASVMRVFINNGSAQTTAANNVFYGEISLPATTISAVAALIELDYSMNLVLNPSFRIYVGLGTTVAAGWVTTAVAGQY